MPLAMLDGLTVGHLSFLVLALAIVFMFEFVNGFHDTANAVATVIYTNSMRPIPAVIWSGLCNFCGVYLGGIAVAFSIVHLLPVDMLVNINTNAGFAMVLALLISAITWNFGTWYLSLPASSSHALIGAILGVGLTNGLLAGHYFGVGLNWHKVFEVGLALLLSPLLGFCLAGILLLISRQLIPNPQLYTAPENGKPPPFWLRAILFLTCTGVSVVHGSNDGQKGVGMVMLILIGLLPAQYALNLHHDPTQIARVIKAATEVDDLVAEPGRAVDAPRLHSGCVREVLEGKKSFQEVAPEQRWQVRSALLHLDYHAQEYVKAHGKELPEAKRKQLSKLRKELAAATEYAPSWVLMAVAVSLGLGTTIGWKRIVVTVGERIGKSHLTYAQGGIAEIVAMSTIGMAVFGGLPVSTTHVLSSAVAGTMAANRSGVEQRTVYKIALAWLLTLPATMLMSGLLLVVFRWFV
ncbi:inorganic phosphate transporter [Anatilimnocola floriformis]|uniref:inorganic phosphate transporter n=1 Tax=Anatilimnocola floriformis TaxID=2948575 RepID=UPI0020C1C08E|nr:inorganic phosphate transporter [Anatilimnocola floriformis]